MSYSWEAVAFKHAGRCGICEEWTRSGVRRSGGMRFRHICYRCARERFAAGDITAWFEHGQPFKLGTLRAPNQGE